MAKCVHGEWYVGNGNMVCGRGCERRASDIIIELDNRVSELEGQVRDVLRTLAATDIDRMHAETELAAERARADALVNALAGDHTDAATPGKCAACDALKAIVDSRNRGAILSTKESVSEPK